MDRKKLENIQKEHEKIRSQLLMDSDALNEKANGIRRKETEQFDEMISSLKNHVHNLQPGTSLILIYSESS